MKNIKEGISWILITLLSFTTTHPIEESTDSNSPYFQIPCDIRPLSGWLDNERNLWGVGANDLWWYNVTAEAWNFVPLPSANHSESSSWRVACGESGHHLVLMSRRDAYIFRIPQREWKRIGKRLPGPAGNRTAQWCHNNTLLLLDLSQSALYQLNPNKVKWTKKAKTLEILQMFNYITHETFKHTVTWYGSNESLYLFLETPTNTSRGSLGSLWTTRLSNVSWGQVAKQSDEGHAWPDLHTEAVTWVTNETLWLWKLGVDMEEVWQFDLPSKTWNQVLMKQTGMEDHLEGPSLTKRLAAWTHKEKLCVLTTRGTCASEYVPGTTWCLHMTLSTNQSLVFNETSESEPENNNIQSDPFLIWNSSSNTLTVDLNRSSIPSAEARTFFAVSLASDYKPKQIASWLPNLDTLSARGQDFDNQDVSLTGLASWPQKHSSVFGFIIFIVSLFIVLAIVGAICCLRKCIYYPKEAMLLRDPPTVRYTAIPDALA